MIRGNECARTVFVVRPYAANDESSVLDLLKRAAPDHDLAEQASLLKALLGPEWARPPGIAMISRTASSVSGLILAEAFRDMPDRWMLQSLIVDPEFRKQGQGTTLLRRLEREVTRRKGVILGIELPSTGFRDIAGRFILNRGYATYDGMGLAKRYPVSRYFLKDMRKTCAPDNLGGEKPPLQSRASI